MDDLTIQVRSENERLKRERDAFAKQFEELSRLRTSESEAVFEKFKARSEEKAKGARTGRVLTISPGSSHRDSDTAIQ